jgi:GNAT superfamily N-acetyltransferase
MAVKFHLECVTPDSNIIKELAELTFDIVQGGASVGFMNPFTLEDAVKFLGKVTERVSRKEILLVLAKDTELNKVTGTVQLILDLPPNQLHRADVAKMQVHSGWRKQGIGEALLKYIETIAIDHGRHLLVLDTVTNSPAYRLYERCGWEKVGDVPEFALFPNGEFCSTTYFYRMLPKSIKKQ